MQPTILALLWVAVITPISALAQGTAPQITSFKIENGSFNTPKQIVTVTIHTAGTTPTAYRLSERADFAGAVWRAFNTSPKVTLVSATATDTITYGLPDLTATVEMPAQVRDGNYRRFEFAIDVKNNGQATPPGEVIYLYSSFVVNQIGIESYDVAFGMSRLVGDGCRITSAPTIECTLAPIPAGGGVLVRLTGNVNRLLTAGQTEASVKLRTRITGIQESNQTNNWIDTPFKVVR